MICNIEWLVETSGGETVLHAGKHDLKHDRAITSEPHSVAETGSLSDGKADVR
jgi:hypothetical protein